MNNNKTLSKNKNQSFANFMKFCSPFIVIDKVKHTQSHLKMHLCLPRIGSEPGQRTYPYSGSEPGPTFSGSPRGTVRASPAARTERTRSEQCSWRPGSRTHRGSPALSEATRRSARNWNTERSQSGARRWPAVDWSLSQTPLTGGGRITPEVDYRYETVAFEGS